METTNQRVNSASFPVCIICRDFSDLCIDELKNGLVDDIMLFDGFNAGRDECENFDEKFIVLQ